jgi:membrane-associated phospholipid phosphatase
LKPAGRYIRPEEAIFLLGIVVLAILHVAFGIAIQRGSETIQHYLIGLSILAFIGTCVNWRLLPELKGEPRRFIRPFLSTCRDWAPFIYVVFVYENIKVLVTVVVPETADPVLRGIDEGMFGGEPTLWMERFNAPLLTDYLAFSYLLYFVLPLSVLAYLYLRERAAYRRFMLAVVVSFVFTFIGYVLVPAEGPRMYMTDAYPSQLSGPFYALTVDRWETIRSITRDCFPSHHTVIALLSMYYAMRIEDRRWRPFVIAVAVLGASLIVSAFYLRYHWFIDIVAGFVVAGISIWIGNNLDRWWRWGPLMRPGHRCTSD